MTFELEGVHLRGKGLTGGENQHDLTGLQLPDIQIEVEAVGQVVPLLLDLGFQHLFLIGQPLILLRRQAFFSVRFRGIPDKAERPQSCADECKQQQTKEKKPPPAQNG